MVEKINTIIQSNTTSEKPNLKYNISYDSDQTKLNLTLENEVTKECFNIKLNFKIPNQLDVDEIIFRFCTFKEEQFLMLEIQEIELITAKSTSNVFNTFKCLVNYDEEFFEMLKSDLDEFINKKNQQYYDDLAEESLFNINKVKYVLNESNKSKIISYWTKILNNQHLNTPTTPTEDQYTIPAAIFHQDNDVNMPKIYHDLIHSSHMLTVLQKEQSYAIDLNSLIHEKDSSLRFVMDEAQIDSETIKWNQRINNLKVKQQKNFKKFLQKLYDQSDQKRNQISDIEDEDEDYFELTDQLTALDIINEPIPKLQRSKSSSNAIYSKSLKLEESYTIQLGAQLKSTHNLRLIRCDIFDFCKERFDMSDIEKKKVLKTQKSTGDVSSLTQLEPQAIQTAMSLYSDKLCALVLLVENSFNIKSESSDGGEIYKNETTRHNAQNWQYLLDLCEKNGTEFHFPSIEYQKKLAFQYASLSKSNNSETKLSDLNIGDFYITKHSNMSQVHILFHLATNENSRERTQSLTSPTKTLKHSDLSSRHPVILGLRNILKACITNNIQTLTIPLLLTHEMNEEMTISWVMKRAELVLKCLKGFMIEFVQWGAQESRTIQFVVPQGLMDETFNSLSNLIPTIFRESRTVSLV